MSQTKEEYMRSRMSISLVLGLLMSAGTLVASERFTIEAKLKPNSTPGSYLCAVQVLEHPGGTTVIEKELAVFPGKPAVGRSGTQDAKGGEVDRKIECSISAD